MLTELLRHRYLQPVGVQRTRWARGGTEDYADLVIRKVTLSPLLLLASPSWILDYPFRSARSAALAVLLTV